MWKSTIMIMIMIILWMKLEMARMVPYMQMFIRYPTPNWADPFAGSEEVIKMCYYSLSLIKYDYNYAKYEINYKLYVITIFKSPLCSDVVPCMFIVVCLGQNNHGDAITKAAAKVAGDLVPEGKDETLHPHSTHSK